MADPVFPLEQFPVHLGLGATVVREPAITDASWFEGYAERHAADGAEGRLVSIFSFREPWPTWEMHPNGSELVVCILGRMTLHQEAEGKTTTVALKAGDAVINPPGVWHTADVTETCTALFVTAGAGTQIRPR